MKPVISVRDLENYLRQGRDLRTLPSDAILTPAARDFLREWEAGQATQAAHGPAPANSAPRIQTGSEFSAPSTELSSQAPLAELEAFFHSPWCLQLKEQMCDIGRRLWLREYVDGNGGNLAIRVGKDLALCTPTLVSKGFMKPEDMCLVDFTGRQLCGQKKRTSEILMHLQIFQRQPRAVATCHCHPPYATGFAVAGLVPPTCLIPEYEVFASVAVAPYRTPGTPEMGKLVADLVDHHNTILMANHGVVSWSHLSLEDAYFKMEILEAYCRTVLVTTQLGRPPQTIPPQQLRELLKIKKELGIPDPRYGLKECELCDNDQWRPGVTCAVSSRAGTEPGLDPEAEQAVQVITDQIMARWK